MDWLRAGFLYSAVVFATGFVIGPLRELVVKPWAGGLWALMIEAPLMILAMVYLAPYAARWSGLATGLARRVAMGAVALAFVLVSEMLAAKVVRGWSLSQWIDHFASPEGLIGIALYVVFAAVPVCSPAIARERAP